MKEIPGERQWAAKERILKRHQIVIAANVVKSICPVPPRCGVPRYDRDRAAKSNHKKNRNPITGKNTEHTFNKIRTCPAAVGAMRNQKPEMQKNALTA